MKLPSPLISGKLIKRYKRFLAEYGRLLRQSADCGVEILAYQTQINPPEVVLSRRIPVRL
jgi:DNA-binding sugar fermentation-stimulating protein